MGLDMYVETRSGKEIAYWRKENALQGWFEENHDIENCGKVPLTVGLIDDIIEDLTDRNMHSTEGFFYGSQGELTEEWYKDMLNQWNDIRKQVLENPDEEYYYTCWY